jgi:hypothetical protein
MIDVEQEQGIADRKFRNASSRSSRAASCRGTATRTAGHHLHRRRPIEEYASNCAVPLVHKAGDVVAETKGIAHWWKNTGDKTVVLLSADLLKDPNDKNM